MIKFFDIMMILIGGYLFTYFINFAMNTTDMYIRLVCCLLATFEVFFLKKHLSNIFSNKKTN